MYYWRAIYNDGSSLSQLVEGQPENRYQDIDRSKLVAFEIVDGNDVKYSLPISEGESLIYRRRITMRMDMETYEMYIIGVKKDKEISLKFVDNNGDIGEADANDIQLLSFE